MKLSQELFDNANAILVKSDYVLAQNPNTPIVFTELNVALRNVLNAVEVEPHAQPETPTHTSADIRNHLLNQNNPEWVDEDDYVLLCDSENKFLDAWYLQVPKAIFDIDMLTDGSPDATEVTVSYDDDAWNMSDADMIELVIRHINLCTLKND